jgi:hypothetical protein
MFLNAVRQHQWDDALPATALVFTDDFPRWTERPPRALAEQVMTQIEDPANLARFTNPAYRLATLILIRAGLRVTDALSLPRRQARQLPGGPTAADAQRRAPPVEVSEQPGRRTPTTTASANGPSKVHLAWRRAEVPVGVQRDITALSAPPTQTHRSRLPPRDGHPSSPLGTRSSACPQPSDPGRHRATSRVKTTRPPQTRQPDNAAAGATCGPAATGTARYFGPRKTTSVARCAMPSSESYGPTTGRSAGKRHNRPAVACPRHLTGQRRRVRLSRDSWKLRRRSPA